jgi:hypothetical protein
VHPERFAQIFFGAPFGAPDGDLVRRKRRREYCQEAMHAIADQHLHRAEMAISRGLLEFHKRCSHDADSTGRARNVISARAEMRRIGGTRADASYTFP